MTDVHEQAGGAPGAGRNRPWYRKWQWWTAGVLVLVAATAGIASALAWTSTPTTESTSTQGSGTTPPAATAVDTPITEALAAEQEAKATYDSVVARFGAVEPFATVSSAEAQHVATLTGLAQRYGVSLFSMSTSGLEAPATMTAACQLGVTTEQEMVTMYAQLLPQVNQYRAATRVFTNLQAAARDNHLPAFEQCATAATTTPTSTAATTSASAPLSTALTTAVTAEQEAKATYDNVIASFGTVQPFATVSRAEGQHIATLEALAQRYGVSLPSGSATGLLAPATITAACQMGVTTEQEMVTMYDLLEPQVAGYPDVAKELSNIQSAERDNHLPAFERCA